MGDYLLRVFTPLIVANCVVLPHAVFADDAVKPVEAKLVAKGDGFWFMSCQAGLRERLRSVCRTDSAF